MASPTRPAWIACALAASGAAALSIPAWITGLPLVASSLGPSLLLAAATPDARESSPGSVAAGHGIAVVAALAVTAAFGLGGEPSALVAGVTTARMAAVPAALALTLAGMLAVGRLHAPAGATALLVVLGIVRPGSDVVVLAATIAYAAAVVALFPAFARRLAGTRPAARRAPAGRGRRVRRPGSAGGGART
jgi:CBS-domain-containing membrane protein